MAKEATKAGGAAQKPPEPARGRGQIVGPADFPDTRLFWRWAGQATRPVVGWVLIALGGLAILLGYLGVSREALVAKQIPFLVSGGITGMVLVAVGAFFLGTEDLRKQLVRLDQIEEQVDELHAVLLSRRDAPTRRPNGSTSHEAGQLLAVEGGSSYHRPDCQMVEGKSNVEVVTPRTIVRRKLDPCGICEPEPVKV